MAFQQFYSRTVWPFSSQHYILLMFKMYGLD